MFNKLSEVLQSATDVIAPPPTPLQDFDYHWRKIKQFYAKNPNEQRIHIKDTTIPGHLNGMLEILVKEAQKDNTTTAPCLQLILTTRPLDLMTDLAIADSPPGMKGAIMSWMRRFLTSIVGLPLDDPAIYQPVLKLLTSTVNSTEPQVVTAYEREEVFFLVALAAALLKCPQKYLNLFVDTHYEFTLKCYSHKTPQQNSLFDASVIEIPNTQEPNLVLQTTTTTDPFQVIPAAQTSQTPPQFQCSCDGNGQLMVLTALTRFLNSPSHEIVLKACEGVLILIVLPEEHLNCNSVMNSFETFIDVLTEKVCYAYSRIPDDIDPLDIELESISWTLNVFDGEERQFIGKLPLVQFLCWLDYFDSVVQELKSSKLIKYILFKFHTELLLGMVQEEVTDGRTASKIMLLTKICKQVRAKQLNGVCVDWLLADCGSVFNTLLANATDNPCILVETLSLVEVFVDEPNLEVLHCLILRHLERRSYFNHQTVQSWSDEEDERERRRGSHGETVKSKTLAPNNILKVINNFLLLLPKQILGGCVGTGYEEYVQDAGRHYRHWVSRTKEFEWPIEAVSPKREVAVVASDGETSRKQDSNDSGIGAEEVFNEGPLLRMLYHYIRNMIYQPYEVNLAVIAIVSKLAFLPHPYLHEVLLNPEVPTLPGVNTLWTTLQEITRQILAQVPLVEDFKSKIEATGRRLLVPTTENNGSATDETQEEIEPDPLLESVIVLEEFAKELAAIAFVKFHYAMEVGVSE